MPFFRTSLLFVFLILLNTFSVSSAVPPASEEGGLAVEKTEAWDAGEISRISPRELKSRIDSGEKVLVVDVRSLQEYNERHITGSVSAPLKQVLSGLHELPRDSHIVFY